MAGTSNVFTLKLTKTTILARKSGKNGKNLLSELTFYSQIRLNDKNLLKMFKNVQNRLT
jgi:hypothetical protein